MLSNSLLTLVNLGALFFPLARTETQLSVEQTMRPVVRSVAQVVYINTSVWFPDQAGVYGVILKGWIIHRAREVETLIVARIRRQLETCRTSFASVAGKHLERAFGEQDVVLADQSRRGRNLDAAEVIDVGLYGNSVSVGTGEV